MTLQYDPEFAEAAAPLLAMRANAPAFADHDIESRRVMIKSIFGALYALIPPVTDVKTTEHKIKSYDGAEILVYRYLKDGTPTTPGPAVLHIHGGGMIGGDVQTFCPGIKTLTSRTGIQYFDVEYRLAPEHPHPTLVEDTYAALLWIHEHADEFNVDRARIGIQGESAGGGIAAGVTLLARDRNLQPPLARSLLVYPMLDYKNVKSIPALDKFLVWDAGSNLTGWTALIGDKMNSDDVSPYASPLYAKDVSGLPPTYIDVGGLDLFRNEDIAYAGRLTAANVPTEFHLYPGIPHGWEIMTPNLSITQQAVANRIKFIKGL